MSNAANVSVAKPKVGGAISYAPKGTPLPTDATTALNAAFKSLGYISDEGLRNMNSPESTTMKAWGGDTVATSQTDKPDTFGFTLIEGMNIEVLKLIYGQQKVTGSLAAGIKVEASAQQPEENAFVIDMILKGGVLKRVVIPTASITELGEITYTDESLIGYTVTLTAIPDENENTHYEYLKSGGGA